MYYFPLFPGLRVDWKSSTEVVVLKCYPNYGKFCSQDERIAQCPIEQKIHRNVTNVLPVERNE